MGLALGGCVEGSGLMQWASPAQSLCWGTHLWAAERPTGASAWGLLPTQDSGPPAQQKGDPLPGRLLWVCCVVLMGGGSRLPLLRTMPQLQASGWTQVYRWPGPPGLIVSLCLLSP